MYMFEILVSERYGDLRRNAEQHRLAKIAQGEPRRWWKFERKKSIVPSPTLGYAEGNQQEQPHAERPNTNLLAGGHVQGRTV